ncbi:hypothetical protein GSbR_07130 [Geobacter sp. SVR]|uniref:hypothetical protein n=1 Tax=Geobacter sp. SVR TaxID=2495594 RepID=UPI00143EF9D0|nr:hypothetical protein [Geobacter sp. SVR]GCF84113.1 hypothetical protein GSbR_07130 [Geobacter sp. SVR]
MLTPAAVEHLNPSGWLLVELGAGQAPEVARIFRECGKYREPIIASDPASIERVVGAQSTAL